MNIKQAETLSGVSRQNIRFYERQGLIHPSRNPENDYREYTDADIATLKTIRLLRMLDMPLEQIASLLEGTLPLDQAVRAQKDRLNTQARQLATAIRFCEELEDTKQFRQMDVDALLSRMEAPENQTGLFQKWVEDYRKLSAAESQKAFTFIPETPVTNPREFSDALFDYAAQNKLDLVITKESMCPAFTIDGIEYTALRTYTVVSRVPVAVIRCTAVHPEDFEPDLPAGRKRVLKLLRLSWLAIPVLLLSLPALVQVGWSGLLSTWEGWLVLLALLSLTGIQLYRYWYFHFNEKGTS